MTNVESMDYTHSHPSIIASLFGTMHCPLSHWELVQNFAGASKHRDTIRSIYYGISIDIPRYIAMQLSTI